MPPNLVIMQCDQMRAFDVGCYGHPMVQTPHIDRLAGEGIRVQTAVSTTIDQQVAQTVDVAPTALNLLGVSPDAAMQGSDLGPVLRGEQPHLPDDAGVIESPHQGLGIRTPRYTLGIPHAEKGSGRGKIGDEPHLLYDNVADPFQRRNHVKDPAYAAVQNELRDRLMAWDRQTPWWS